MLGLALSVLTTDLYNYSWNLVWIKTNDRFFLDIGSQVFLNSLWLHSLADGHKYVAVRKRSRDVCVCM